MANHLGRLMNDIITVVNKDGSRYENIRASVQRDMIVTFDVTVPIAAGDKIERILPSAQKEVFIVTNAHLYSGVGTIKSFYEISYEREDAQHRQAERPAAINVHVSGSPQARVNLHSTDESINVSNAQPEIIFSELRDLLHKSVNDVSDRELKPGFLCLVLPHSE